ncbi:hypothetical protein ABIF69_007574 [Bradyrhizobium japonicum]
MSKVSEQKPLQKEVARAWDLALTGTPVLYLSGPITTGKRFVDLLRARQASTEAIERVRRENIDELLAAARQLRLQRNSVVVEPGSLEVRDWSQSDYHTLWEHLIEHHASAVVFMPGWEYSIGCTKEFGHALRKDIRMETLGGNPLSREEGIALLRAAELDLRSNGDSDRLLALAEELRSLRQGLAIETSSYVVSHAKRKDESLDFLAKQGMNVAQFVSFSPEAGKPYLAHARICDWTPSTKTSSRDLIRLLLERSSDGLVNIRSFQPHDAQSREFIYGLGNIDEAVNAVSRLSREGMHTIVNETIDVHDGGVSGVLMGGVMEFSPDDTPRCVEKPGTASLPRGIGRELLAAVYSVPIDLAVPFATRLEFSIHPRPRGWKRTNVLVWEFSDERFVDLRPDVKWPNNFSRMLGDKTFGLLIADQFGLPVPHTTVINRRIAPFSFGRDTGWHERWIRTAPLEQMPGLFSTYRGWTDPFALMKTEDAAGTKISSVLSQAGVYPAFSGALIVSADGRIIIEGRRGAGDSLMLGETQPEDLPENVVNDIHEVYRRAEAAFGPVRFEWVHDGRRLWVVQFHRGATETTDLWLTPGDADSWIEFDVAAGLSVLREVVSTLPPNTGIVLSGRIGLTSHLADLLRKTRTPARMKN